MEQENYNSFDENNIPEEYKPLSVGKFIGYNLLFMIPCVGLILLIVFACKGVKNKNVINWARAQLILTAIVVLLYILLLVFGVGAAIFTSGVSSMY